MTGSPTSKAARTTCRSRGMPPWPRGSRTFHRRAGGSGSMTARAGGPTSIAARTTCRSRRMAPWPCGFGTFHSRAGSSGSMTARAGGPTIIPARTLGSRTASGRTRRSRSMAAGARGSWTDAMESLVPTSSLAAMVGIIEILVVMLTRLVPAVIGIFLFESPYVLWVPLIPGLILRRVPGNGSDNIGGRIRVIRGPPILTAEVVIQ